jgi:predicted  nucleic acid-binding Zn-ribbon protein
MNATASLVQTLHRINRQKSDLKGQLDRGPRTVAAAQMQLNQAVEHSQATRDRLKKAKMLADSKQLQLLEREQKIHKWQGMLNQAKENREYQALKDQIAADTQANAVLSDEILDLLEQIDQIETLLKEAEKTVVERTSNLGQVQQQVADRRVVLESELARVEKELSETEAQLSGEFKRDYLRLVGALGEDAMAEVDGNCCSGCCKSLTPMMLDRLSMGQSVTCASCGRLVYKTSDR